VQGKEKNVSTVIELMVETEGGSMNEFENNLNKELIDIWKSNFIDDDPLILMPIFFSDIKRGGIVFIGMNPSFSEKGIKSSF